MPPQNNPTEDASSKLNKINVMVVDGSAKAGELIKSILSQLGFKNVFLANDGFQGVKMMSNARIDMIFSDWDLFILGKNSANDDIAREEPKPLSGPMFIKRLRVSPSSPNPFVPVIMLLNKASEKEVAEARDAGVNEIVLKPFSADDLCKKIIRIIDHPRPFITAETYKGPCRRISKSTPPNNVDRRKREVRIFRHGEKHL
jgi:CheY-like chemotaxis protein